jgi:hypothetical protein
VLLAACGSPEPGPVRDPPPAEMHTGGTLPEPEPVSDWPPGELRTGGALPAAELAADETHRYRLQLDDDSFLRLVVDQQGVDAKVTLTDPDGARLIVADRLIGAIGPELVLVTTERAGDYGLAIQSIEGTHGPYRARIEALRPATAADRRNAEAYRRLAAAKDLPPAPILKPLHPPLTFPAPGHLISHPLRYDPPIGRNLGRPRLTIHPPPLRQQISRPNHQLRRQAGPKRTLAAHQVRLNTHHFQARPHQPQRQIRPPRSNPPHNHINLILSINSTHITLQ